MGSPLSGLLSDIYINNFENKFIFTNQNKFLKNIVHYSRYVDDTFLIFNGTNRQINNFLNYINSIHKNIKFTVEFEKDNSLNFLDLKIIKENNKLNYDIYRKNITTDSTININSYHPYTQKLAAYNSLIHRALNVPLNTENFNKEIRIIKQIAHANGYKYELIDKLIRKHKNKNKENNNSSINSTQNNNIIYTSSKFTNLLPNILKTELNKLNICIGFKTNNNIFNLLKNKNKINIDICTGIYKINCNDCNMFYIGQIGRPLKDRFSEHLPTKKNLIEIMNNNNNNNNNDKNKKIKSNYAKHITDNNHNYTNINKNLEALYYCKKGKYMNAVEEFFIYVEYQKNPHLLLNDQLNFNTNYLYDTAIKYLNLNNNNNSSI